MPDPVTLVRWRRADTDPPDGDMDRRIIALHEDGKVEGCDAYYLGDQDYVLWAEYPTPPGDDALTVDDLEAAHDAAQMLTGSDFHKRDWPRMYRCQDRLRAALDALTREGST